VFWLRIASSARTIIGRRERVLDITSGRGGKLEANRVRNIAKITSA
jgi:hypothetical protein